MKIPKRVNWYKTNRYSWIGTNLQVDGIPYQHYIRKLKIKKILIILDIKNTNEQKRNIQ